MSLLDRGNTDAILYPEEVVTDRDGNTRTRASKTGIPIRIWIQPQGQSGTAARRAEQDNEGYETEKVLRMRLPRRFMHLDIGAQSKIEIDGQMWSVFGDVIRYIGSPRTAHHDYTLRRA